jgi:hypothetical protein
MIIYLGKHHVNDAADVTSAHRIGLKLTREVEGVRQIIFHGQLFFITCFPYMLWRFATVKWIVDC